MLQLLDVQPTEATPQNVLHFFGKASLVVSARILKRQIPVVAQSVPPYFIQILNRQGNFFHWSLEGLNEERFHSETLLLSVQCTK